MTDSEISEQPAKSQRNVPAIMRQVHSSDTAPEVAFKRALTEHSVAFLSTNSDLPGKPDIVIPDARLAIFIDGDFWHGNQWRRRRLTQLEDQFTQTATKTYWLKKIHRNMARDCAVTVKLLAMGWRVLRLWESDINTRLDRCIEIVLQALEQDVAPNHRALLPQKSVAEFFAGIGLMRMGLDRQGWVVSFANDIDPAKIAMYSAQFEDKYEPALLADVHTLTAEHIPTVTLATASFPCTDLSLAGGREGIQGKASSAFWGFTRILDELGSRKPALVLIENVTGFLTSHNGLDFFAAMRELNRLGYSVDAFILDAARFVPQSRPRLFVIGTHDILYTSADVDLQPHTPVAAWPEPLESALRPTALATYMQTHAETIRWRVRSLPSPPFSERTLEDILEDVSHDNPVWWSVDRAAYLLSQMSPKHRAQADTMIMAEKWSYGTVFRRMRVNKVTGRKQSMAELRTDGLAGCLRTPKGGSAKQIVFKAGYGQYFARLMTPREAARLMGVNDFVLPQSLDQALFGFGDAVCVPVVAWIAEHYLNPVVNELIRGHILAE